MDSRGQDMMIRCSATEAQGDVRSRCALLSRRLPFPGLLLRVYLSLSGYTYADTGHKAREDKT